MVGVAMVFSMTKTIDESAGRAQALKRVFVRRPAVRHRNLLLRRHHKPMARHSLDGCCLEPHCAGLPSLPECCFSFLFKPRALAGICAGLLVGYWALMTFVPFPDVRPTPDTTVIAKETGFTNDAQLNLSRTQSHSAAVSSRGEPRGYVDQKYLPARKYDGAPGALEGILGTMPAVATCLLGVFAGFPVRTRNVGETRKVTYLVAFGAAAVSVLTPVGCGESNFR